MKNKGIVFFILFILLNVTFAQSKKELFANADDLITQLKELNAELFSPLNFHQGLNLYNNAKKLYDAGASGEQVFSMLQEAESYFYKAMERAKINRDLFAYVAELRSKAFNKAGKSESAKPFLIAGEEDFTNGILLSENERSAEAIKEKIKNAVRNFNAAIIIAKKENVFAPVVEMREAGKKAEADFYSPHDFDMGEKKFGEAIDFAANNNGEDFIKSVIAAERFFKRAYSNTVLFTSNFEQLKTAVDYAKKAEAAKYAPDEWNKAVETMTEASQLFENKDLKEAKAKAVQAAKLFWDAEEAAIYNKYIGNLRNEFVRLKEKGAEKYDPAGTRRVELLLSKLETVFQNNRYDKRIGKLSRRTDAEIRKLKEIVRLYETKNKAYIDSLILNEIYPFGETAKTSTVKKDNNETTKSGRTIVMLPPVKQSINEKNTTRKNSTAKARGTKNAASGKSENLSQKRKEQTLRNRKTKTSLEKTIARFNKIFGKDEAVLLWKNDNSFKIRLVGLKLKAYQKELTPQQKNLLMKLRNVIVQSGKVKKVIVEVYSDSMGGDELNKRLSQSRADIVKATLVKYGVNGNIIVAEGIGNKNPIASNATFEGRNKNRRIEVIFVF